MTSSVMPVTNPFSDCLRVILSVPGLDDLPESAPSRLRCRLAPVQTVLVWSYWAQMPTLSALSSILGFTLFGAWASRLTQPRTLLASYFGPLHNLISYVRLFRSESLLCHWYLTNMRSSFCYRYPSSRPPNYYGEVAAAYSGWHHFTTTLSYVESKNQLSLRARILFLLFGLCLLDM